MLLKKSSRLVLTGLVASSMVLAACSSDTKGKRAEQKNNVELTNLNEVKMSLAEFSANNPLDESMDLPIVENGYPGNIVQDFINYLAGELPLADLMESIKQTDSENLVIARTKVQETIRQMNAKNVLTEEHNQKITELSAAINAHIEAEYDKQALSETAVYTSGALIGAFVGVTMHPTAINKVGMALGKLAEKSKLKQVRDNYNKWRAKPSVVLERAPTRPAIQFARITESAAQYEKRNQSFFKDMLGAATLTNPKRLNNVEVKFLGGSNDDSVKGFLEVKDLDWMPTHIAGVQQANTGKRVAYRISTGTKTTTVGFKDMSQEVTRLDAGNMNTRQVVQLVNIKKRKQAEVQRLSLRYGEMKSKANAGRYVDQNALTNADIAAASIERINNKWLSRIDYHINEQALKSAEARYAGKVKALAAKEKALAKTQGQIDRLAPASTQGPLRKQSERIAKAERAKAELTAKLTKLEKEVNQLGTDVKLMDELSAAIRNRAEAKSQVLLVKEGSDESKRLQARIAKLDAEIKDSTDLIVINEIETAARASAHLANQPFATTLARSGQFGNEALARSGKIGTEPVGLLFPGEVAPRATGMNTSQILAVGEVDKAGRLVTVSDARAKAVAASTAVMGTVVIGGGADLLMIDDYMGTISVEELQQAVEALPEVEDVANAS